MAYSQEEYDAEKQRITSKEAAKGYTVVFPDTFYAEADTYSWTHGVTTFEAIRIFAQERGYIAAGNSSQPETSSQDSQEAVNQEAAETKQEVQTEPEQPVANENTVETKNYSHGIYEDINDSALEAFNYFLEDGEKNSCYIQIDVNASNKVMPAGYISRTESSHENGEVQFVDENGKIVYSYLFAQVTAEEDLDLSVDITEENGVIKVSPKTQKMSFTDLGYPVCVKVNCDYNPAEKFYIYTKSNKAGESYIEYMETEANENGENELKIEVIQDYYISREPLVEKKDSPTSEEQIEISNENKEIEDIEAPVESNAFDNAEPAPITDNSENKDLGDSATGNIYAYVLTGVGFLVLCGVIMFLVYKKKN